MARSEKWSALNRHTLAWGLINGSIPDGFGLKAQDAAAQFIAMAKTWDYSRMDFVGEVSINRKAVYLNFLFWLLWSRFDFTLLGVNEQRRDALIQALPEAWDLNDIDVPLPVP